MSRRCTSRRGFLRKSAAAMAAAGIFCGRTPLVRAARLTTIATHAIRLGAPVFGVSQDPEEIALAHVKLGYRAAYCPKVALSDADRIRDIRTAFAKHDVVIAEVGVWNNLLDADPAKRAADMAAVTEGLALAEAVGARCCVTRPGNFNATNPTGPHPKNVSRDFFDAVVENARKIIDAVKPKRAKFCYEAMFRSLPDSPDSYVELIKAVDRPGFGAHLDPCNLINSPRRFYDNAGLLNECFDKLGPWLVSCHAKDLAWEVGMSVHFREVCLGDGSLDYTTYLRRLAATAGDVPLMIEHMKDAAEYDKSRRWLLELGGKIGVRFE